MNHTEPLDNPESPYTLIEFGETVVFDGKFVADMLDLICQEVFKPKDRIVCLAMLQRKNAPVMLKVGGGIPHSTAYKLRRLGVGHTFRPLAPDLETHPVEHFQLTGLGLALAKRLAIAQARAIEEARRVEEGRDPDGGVVDNFSW